MKEDAGRADAARELEAAVAGIAPSGVSVSVHPISAEDLESLLPVEVADLSGRLTAAIAASASARVAARRLLEAGGKGQVALPRVASGAVAWPAGIVGSLAHDSKLAVAAIAANDIFTGIGIDVEPAEPLSEEMMEMIATPAEILQCGNRPVLGRVLFCIKEAVYKAYNPLTGRFLDFHDVEVDLKAGIARVSDGRTVDVFHHVGVHIVALACIRR